MVRTVLDTYANVEKYGKGHLNVDTELRKSGGNPNAALRYGATLAFREFSDAMVKAQCSDMIANLTNRRPNRQK